MNIKVENITKKYGDFLALKDVSLSVNEGELLALLGSSGCGKTTLLRIIAGLIEHNSGRIFLNDSDISDWPAQKRNTAMVFQNYALFPHMTLEENIAYGLKLRKLNKKEINIKVMKVLEKVRLGGLGKRKIQELSGGQKQRAALARALVIEPDILLFDEPLSNLDEKLRVSMRKEIRRIQKDTGITSIYVTHDQREAMAIADKIAIMDGGKILQYGNVDDIYYRPENRFTAEFMGHINIFQCSTQSSGQGKYIEFLGKRIETESEKEIVDIILRPEEVEICDDGIEAEVTDIETMGPIIRYRLKAADYELYSDMLNKSVKRSIDYGDKVKINFNENTLHIF
ncbi:iron(III) transport system ATP-binding protein [Dethiosulfatibacter aminovorans DSM 17477]|uniref:ABC-type quaternary amine transporter n=1 Tax=Dethiosulfatibacter aminovorans DSM 17477 TaxID=1121476 RepID=A0A1M6AR49_9FIRM|nr:ABC transporter ATP-binding protein [Dethiosulfatibacter aminovorans]SHI38994.1 iron(III) transport system ATP-binding protein [Dethiosulfatibacter aminovorans DSM 17477]